MLKQCLFCDSTDGAFNEVCNFHFMVFQDVPEFNDYCKKFDEMETAKQKLKDKVLMKND